jgi:UrcA family protein
MSRTIIVLSAAALCLAATSPACADEGVMKVRIGDLNLNSPAGAQAALARTIRAADQFCGGAPDLRQIDRARRAQACRDAMLDRAVQAMNVPLVSSLHRNPHAVTFVRR